MRVLSYISELVERSHASHTSAKKLKKLTKAQPAAGKTPSLHTVEIKVKMDCEGCERRVRKSVEGMKGVTQVDIEPKKSKLTLIGYVDPDKVLNRVRHRTGKAAVMWPYVPYGAVDHPYALGVYDKKAPPGYVRNALEDPLAAGLARGSSTEVKYMTAFSDENPNACNVM
ncbi:hypothetical protein RJ639_046686 [Escallonia herrerae]|uniref:HMA domain-containing protein n=1 Tax=Escallonia herrerae TaxID=1293975 RepID=A0AA89B2T0_9ASTE|nr:hypothetical protein RJ639_046686 [Escallonia herrerae]